VRKTTEEAARWFARMHDAGPNHPDQARFQAWLAASPVHAAEYRTYAEIWDNLESAEGTEAIADTMEHRLRTRRTVLRSSIVILGAGTLGGGALYELDRYRTTERLAFSTHIGELHTATLSDGSTVTLGADSTMDVAYSAAERWVDLGRGEAIFEVSPNPRRPFVIKAGAARVTVLGTRFAVARLPGMVRVSVDHGRVRMETGPFWWRRRLLLTADQVGEATIDANTTTLQLTPKRAENGLAFAHGEIRFDQARLAEIAQTLSRYSRRPVRSDVAPGSGPAITAIVQARDIDRFPSTLRLLGTVSVEERPDGVTLAPAL
jgi:transmembrane sensor